MTDHQFLENRKDRYVRGELTPAEARQLAQRSLDSRDLFDELADSALAKAALESGALESGNVVRFPHKAWIAVAAVAAAAAAVAVVVLWMRPAPATPRLKPDLALNQQGRPVLLASGLHPNQAPNQTEVFRGAETDLRAPQTAGSIVSIEEDLATIDLGSLDGLDQGSELPVFREGLSTQPIGRLQVTTVFRERARARIVDGKVQANDAVRVEDAAHLTALVERVDALYNRGDADAAYTAAEQAAQWLEHTSLPPARQAELWNQLAVMRMLRGDYQNAEPPLNRAVSAADAQGLNNLGVLAELRGDRRAAESHYARALQALSTSNPSNTDRRTIEANSIQANSIQTNIIQANLARVRGSH